MDTTHLHTFTAGRFEITVRVSVVKIREISTAFDDPETYDPRPLAEHPSVSVEAVPVEAVPVEAVSAEDIRRAALRVTEIGGGRGSKSARWSAMCDLLELWVKRYGDPPRWSEVAEPGEGHDPIQIGQWYGNERGRRRNGKMTVAQRERMDKLLGDDWAAMRRSPYGVSKR